MRVIRLLVLSLAAGTGAATTTTAASATEPNAAVTACLDEHAEGQRAERRGELQSARAHYAKCVDFACPDAVRHECDAWRVRVEQALPSIVIRMRDVAAKVWVDDTPIPAARTGLAIDVDPGPHKVRVEADGFRPAEQSIVVAAGEKARVINIDLSEAPSPALHERARAGPAPAPSPWPYVLGGFGIVSLGVFLGVGLDARSRFETLDGSCSPRCNPDDVDSLHRRYVVADIALGVGSAAIVASAIWLLLRASSHGVASAPVTPYARAKRGD
jgi:hypothetical protein